MKKVVVLIVMMNVVTQLFAPEASCLYLVEGSVEKRGFIHWADDLGWEESRNNPHCVNVIGCFGEHQWKESTLRSLGYDVTLEQFKVNSEVFPPDMQRRALRHYMEYNRCLLQPYNYYIGQWIRGVRITESGLLAACHLGGFDSVRLFLETKGKINRHDLFGTSIKDYIELFAGYCLDN